MARAGPFGYLPGMENSRVTRIASAIVLATGAAWGLYWLPVRALDALGLPGAWGTAAITAAAAVLLAAATAGRWRGLAAAPPATLLSVALGGAAFALYSVGLVYGRVAIVILLYFLTPVWSVLIARLVLGWETPRLRLLAIAVGLAGLAVMLGADGGAPLPRRAGEWMGLVAGLLWSVATTGMRTRAALPPREAALVFALGATIAALALAPFLAPWPGLSAIPRPGAALGVAVLAGAGWWGLSSAVLMWATPRLEPARVGILLMAEVLVGAVSAALIAGERLGPLEIAGGALVLSAGLLEIWPVRARPPGRL